MKIKTVLSFDNDILIEHVALAWVAIGDGVVLWESECLIRCIRYVKHSILHEVDHQEGEGEEKSDVEADLE